MSRVRFLPGPPGAIMDIVVFAVIAILLCYRLYTVLGRDEGPIPQSATSINNQPPIEKVAPQTKLDRELRRYNIPLFLKPAFSEILLKDPSFDFKDFLEGAERAYEMIVTHALQGELKSISEYVGSKAVRQLEKLPKLERFRIKVSNVAIVDAEAHIPEASITVQFEAAVQGEPHQEDWVFKRDLDNENPTWILEEILCLKK